jgi:hypothetical protein
VRDYRVLLGYVVVFLVIGLGSKFLWTAYFDPDFPYLPEGSDALILFVTGTMGAAIQWALSTASSALTGRQHDRATQAALYATPPLQVSEPPTEVVR